MQDPTIDQVLLNYHNNWYINVIILSILGTVLFTETVKRLKIRFANTTSKALGWLFKPRIPENIYIIGEDIYYDDEIKLIKGEKDWHLITSKGLHYTIQGEPETALQLHSAFSVRTPKPSIFSVAVRWIIASTIIVYGAIFGFLSSYFDPRINVLKTLTAIGYTIQQTTIVQVMADRNMNLAVATIIASITIAWWIANILRLNSRNLKVYEFVPIAMRPGGYILIPAINSYSKASIFQVIGRIIKDGIRIEVDETSLEAFNTLKKKLKVDTATLAQLLNRASLTELWRYSLGDTLEQLQDLKDASIAECRLRGQDLAKTTAKHALKLGLLALIAGIVVGAVLGYLLGLVVGIPHPANTTIPTAPGSITPAPLPPPPTG